MLGLVWHGNFKMISEIIYQKEFVDKPDEAFSILLNEVAWVREQERRAEAFMAHKPTEYRYLPQENAPSYKSTPYHALVHAIETRLNIKFGCKMNLCFLNYYANQSQALGWHSDDGEIIDQTQPIVVVSLGVERDLWVREIGYKGEIPSEWKFTLHNGSVFIMPKGFQNLYQHRIPKGGREMAGRISLTYRASL